ncbi:hypothetical protein [Haloferax sp. DFSO60]|uniref:hypothetical protein n=1 Tax=Haloferax sp. DFSO60 TaxID=3388652 RepID=UPI00397C4B71
MDLELSRQIAIVLGIVLLGSFFIADSPYNPTVHTEAYPYAPDRPAQLNDSSVRNYAVEYEEMLLNNELVKSRGLVLDRDDETINECTVTELERQSSSEFVVSMRCHGGIRDIYRVIQPTNFRYEVTYRITPESTEQASIQGYPLGGSRYLREPYES